MIIDAHNHPGYHGYTADRLIENMDRYGIDTVWLLSWLCERDEFDPNTIPYFNLDSWTAGPVAFEHCLACRERYPDRVLLGYAPDPRRADAIDRLACAVELYGVRICGEVKLRMMYDNPDAIRLFRYAGKLGLPVTLHFDYEFDTGARYPRPNYWYGGDIGVLERVLDKCPETNFLGHAPGFWAHISGDDQYDQTPYPKGEVKPNGKVLALLDRYPNLYGDLSAGSGLNALTRDPAFGKWFLVQYADRLVFARDLFENIHREYLDGLGLDQAVLDQIYWKNAMKLTGDRSTLAE